MNAVERVKQICKERKIALSKLEKDCGFANGYITRLKKGVFPDDRVLKICEYLGVSVNYLMTGKEHPEETELLSYEISKDKNKINRIYHIGNSASARAWKKVISHSIEEAIDALPTITEDQEALLDSYEMLTEEAQEKVDEYISDLLCIGRYCKSGKPVIWDDEANEYQENQTTLAAHKEDDNLTEEQEDAISEFTAIATEHEE